MSQQKQANSWLAWSSETWVPFIEGLVGTVLLPLGATIRSFHVAVGHSTVSATVIATFLLSVTATMIGFVWTDATYSPALEEFRQHQADTQELMLRKAKIDAGEDVIEWQWCEFTASAEGVTFRYPKLPGVGFSRLMWNDLGTPQSKIVDTQISTVADWEAVTLTLPPETFGEGWRSGNSFTFQFWQHRPDGSKVEYKKGRRSWSVKKEWIPTP